LSAGIAPATLKLLRGGEVRICPRSSLSVSAGAHGLLLATGASAIEINYQLTQEAIDVVITPDFNVTLAGPGTFHFALEVSKKGDITFSELLGTGAYTAKSDEAALFPGGKLDQRTTFSGECGCPPTAPVLHAETAPAIASPKENNSDAKPAERVVVATNDPTSPVPPDHPGQVHVQVDAPFVFSARSSAPRPYSVAKIKVSTLPNVFFVQEQVDPVVLTQKPAEVSVKAEVVQPKPAENPKKEKKGFMGRVKGFFGSLFHR